MMFFKGHCNNILLAVLSLFLDIAFSFYRFVICHNPCVYYIWLCWWWAYEH